LSDFYNTESVYGIVKESFLESVLWFRAHEQLKPIVDVNSKMRDCWLAQNNMEIPSCSWGRILVATTIMNRWTPGCNRIWSRVMRECLRGHGWPILALLNTLISLSGFDYREVCPPQIYHIWDMWSSHMIPKAIVFLSRLYCVSWLVVALMIVFLVGITVIVLIGIALWRMKRRNELAVSDMIILEMALTLKGFHNVFLLLKRLFRMEVPCISTRIVAYRIDKVATL
jgi:hypothetical protein